MYITFETQKDFEDAVMAVLSARLSVRVKVSKDYNEWHGDWLSVNVALEENGYLISWDEADTR